MTTTNNRVWKAAPSGLVKGNLNRWRQGMFRRCPKPYVGQVVVVENSRDESIGYKALTAEGYNTRWQRVACENVAPEVSVEPIFRKAPMRTVDTKCGGYVPNHETYIYLSDGVYIHEDDLFSPSFAS